MRCEALLLPPLGPLLRTRTWRVFLWAADHHRRVGRFAKARQSSVGSRPTGALTGRLTVMSRCLVVSVGLRRGSLGGGLGWDQGIKAHREQDGSGGISGFHLPPP